jgi:hypothetical protein
MTTSVDFTVLADGCEPRPRMSAAAARRVRMANVVARGIGLPIS